jgi:hypothetical protein
MAQYGTMIDEFASVNEDIYEMFTNYFNNPIMIKTKNEDRYSVYVCKLYCLLNKDCRYIIVFTKIDQNPINAELPLKILDWVSLQTRTLPYDEYSNIKSHGYIPKEMGPLLAKINRTNITDEASTYECDDYPIIITLLHTRNKTSLTYQNSGTVIAALETWETIITFNEN